jgi:UDP-N-acetylglucosamine 4-epimerase
LSKRILITGGAGFIGSNLCEYLLKQGYEIRALDNLATGRLRNIEQLLAEKNFEFIEGDIRNLETCRSAVKGFDVVMHQAALGSVPRSIDRPIDTNAVNIDGFVNMLVAAKDEGIERFIYAASSSTYGDSKELPKVEERIGKPMSPYAVTKLVNELYADVFHKIYGLKTIGLRYFNVFGRNQDPDGAYAAAIPRFVKAFMEGRSPEIHGDGEQTRDFTYIENVLHANECALQTQNEEAFNQVFNVAYGQRTSVNQIVKKLQHLLAEKDPGIQSVEIVYGPARQGDVRDSLADVSKAKRLMGYNPEFDVLQGIERAIDWYWEDLK